MNGTVLRIVHDGLVVNLLNLEVVAAARAFQVVGVCNGVICCHDSFESRRNPGSPSQGSDTRELPAFPSRDREGADVRKSLAPEKSASSRSRLGSI